MRRVVVMEVSKGVEEVGSLSPWIELCRYRRLATLLP